MLVQLLDLYTVMSSGKEFSNEDKESAIMLAAYFTQSSQNTFAAALDCRDMIDRVTKLNSLIMEDVFEYDSSTHLRTLSKFSIDFDKRIEILHRTQSYLNTILGGSNSYGGDGQGLGARAEEEDREPEEGPLENAEFFKKEIESKKAFMPLHTYRIAMENVRSYEEMSQDSSMAPKLKEYLRIFVALPWGVLTNDALDVDSVRGMPVNAMCVGIGNQLKYSIFYWNFNLFCLI
jgi:hypothetical protein